MHLNIYGGPGPQMGPKHPNTHNNTNRPNATAIDVSRRDLSIGAKKSRYECLLHGATLGANTLFLDPPETPLKVMLEGRSRSFLVGLTPNQDAYDATTHP